MSTDVVTPKGWRRLEKGTIIRHGDNWWSQSQKSWCGVSAFIGQRVEASIVVRQGHKRRRTPLHPSEKFYELPH